MTITLNRIGPKTHGSLRSLDFKVRAGATDSSQSVSIKDSDGDDEFTGPMADADDAASLGSPMPGLVEKVDCSEGQSVSQGDVLMTVSAMKMEVHVKAPFDATVGKVVVEAGDKVIEGALLANLVAN